MRRYNSEDRSNPVIVTWETKTAKFIHIEISLFHIFRIKIDKGIGKKEGVS